jgi:hypothetical protein
VCYTLGRKAFHELLGPIEDVWRYETLRKARGGSDIEGCRIKAGQSHSSVLVQPLVHNGEGIAASPLSLDSHFNKYKVTAAGAHPVQLVRAAAVPAGALHGQPQL